MDILIYISYRFIVKNGSPGLEVSKIENKIGLRMVQNGDILLKKVFVPDEDRLSGINSFKDINKVISLSIISIYSIYSILIHTVLHVHLYSHILVSSY